MLEIETMTVSDTMTHGEVSTAQEVTNESSTASDLTTSTSEFSNSVASATSKRKKKGTKVRFVGNGIVYESALTINLATSCDIRTLIVISNQALQP